MIWISLIPHTYDWLTDKVRIMTTLGMLTLENAGSVRWRCTLITVAYWCCYYCKWCCVATYDAILHTHCVALLSWGRKIGCFCSKSNPIQMLRVNLCIALYVQWNMQKITYSFVTPTCITFRYSNKLYKTTVTAVYNVYVIWGIFCWIMYALAWLVTQQYIMPDCWWKLPLT